MAQAKTEVKKEEQETYKITLPISREEQDDVWVSINGKSVLIQRGVEVEVTRPVYKVLKNKLDMESLALQRSRALAEGKTID